MLTALILAAQVMGPPAPTQYEPHRAAIQDAEASWKWYAGAWAINAASTTFVIRGGGQESNPLPGLQGHPYRTIAAKGLVALAGWRAEVWAARRGGHGAAKVGRWIFVVISCAVAGYEFSVAF